MSKDKKSKLLSVDQLGSGRRFAEYDVPHVEGSRVRIQSLTEWEQSKFESAQLKRNGRPDKAAIESSRRKYICLCVVDDDGGTYLKPDDLRNADARVVNFLYRVCADHNGLNDDEQEAILGN